jgi:polygalacturonase
LFAICNLQSEISACTLLWWCM